MISLFKKKQLEPVEPDPAQIEKLRNQVILEERIQKAVSRYGKEITVGMPLHDAYLIISECLEQGADALGSNVTKT